jgi:uncharacterized membrane protein
MYGTHQTQIYAALTFFVAGLTFERPILMTLSVGVLLGLLISILCKETS